MNKMIKERVEALNHQSNGCVQATVARINSEKGKLETVVNNAKRQV
jgi:hypothetical protein